MPAPNILSVILLAHGILVPSSRDVSGLPLEGMAAEVFLRSARVVDMEPLGEGITRPQKVTLTDGEQTWHAVWKTIDDFRPIITQAEEGPYQAGFRDSYRYEIAAYEIDKLLGIGLVPPTVPRVIDGKRGSLQLWVENAISEAKRRKLGLRPQRPGEWSQQMANRNLLNQLIYNEDANNVGNLLYDESFRVYAIDHSRSFRLYDSLPRPEALLRFSRDVLDRLRSLDLEQLRETVGEWLSEREMEAVLKRRDRIVARADELIARFGESVVLF